MTALTFTVQLEDRIEQQVNSVLADLNISKNEAVRVLFEYIAMNRKLPKISPVKEQTSDVHLTDLLMTMPNVAEDSDFERLQDNSSPDIFT